MRLRLTPRVRRDVEILHDAGVERFGDLQAERYLAGIEDAFALLAAHPRAFRERTETTPPVRVYRYQSHLIVYIIQDDTLLVVRVPHGREDWLASL